MSKLSFKDKHKDNSGQSSIEFLATFVFVINFLVLFVKLAFHYTNGYLVHYATYMSSRTYLVYENNSDEAQAGDASAFTKAQTVFKQYNLDAFIPSFNNQLQVNTVDKVGRFPYVGVYTEFQANFSPSVLVGGKKPVRFVSESFLGREPSRFTCLERICNAMKEVGGNCEIHNTLADNGC